MNPSQLLSILGLAFAAGTALAVTSGAVTPSAAQAAPSAADQTKTIAYAVSLPWGTGTSQVGLKPEQIDTPAQGPSSVAVMADGSALVLDRVNERVVRLAPGGGPSDPWTFAKVAPDVKVIGVGRQSAEWLVFSPLRSRGWSYREGTQISHWQVPRVLPDIRSFSFDRTGKLIAHASYQERFVLGQLASDKSLGDILRSKREGAFETARGGGVSVRAREDGRLEWLVYPNVPHPARFVTRHIFDIHALSGRLLGVREGVGCMLVEQGPTNTTTAHVHSSVLCAEVMNGTKVLTLKLPDQQVYVPRDFIAYGGQKPRLVHIRTTSKGLEVRSWKVPTTREAGK